MQLLNVVEAIGKKKSKKIWKQPKLPLTDECTKWYIHTMEYYSGKEEGNSDIWDNVDKP